MKNFLFFLAAAGGIIWLIPGVFITTRGCQMMPIDLVIGDTCFFGSLILSFGASAVMTIIAIFVVGIGALLKHLFFQKTDVPENNTAISDDYSNTPAE